jgi:NADPH:quinone reductase-like Zn-dependent oxidoreductase
MATKARAHVIARAGSLAQTLEQRDVELPALGADEVRVRVAYAALNPVD